MKKQVMCKDCKKVGKCGKPYVEISTYAERCPLFDAKKPTNYELIKAMSVEDMAYNFVNHFDCNLCSEYNLYSDKKCDKNCVLHFKEWLESEVQNDE